MEKSKKIFTIGRSIAMISALLLITSAFLVWGYNDNVSLNGIKGRDSIIVISIGILAFIFMYIKRIPIWISLILGIIGFSTCVVDVYAMYHAATSIDGHVGIGLHLACISSFGIILGVVIEILEERDKKLKLAYLDE